MKRTLRLALPIAAVAAAVVAGVLLTTQPWSGETPVQEAAAGTIQHRVCDLVIEAPSAGSARDAVVVSPRRGEPLGEPLQPVMKLKLLASGQRSEAWIDARTGTTLEERYGTASQKAIMQGALQTARVEPLDAATAPWPYTQRTQVSLERQQAGVFEYRPPDPASGIVVSHTYVDTEFGKPLVQIFEAKNCRSTMLMRWELPPDAPAGVTVTKDIHPDDAAAFQTLLDAVVVKGLDQ
jgi:hypothetical protein